MSSIPHHPLQQTAFAAAVTLLCTPAAYSHTTSVGYENAGPGSVTFWYGTYHQGTNYTEGSLKVTGPNNYSSTVSFSQLVNTKPSGLIDGTTNFYSDGSQLVSTYGGTIYAWQGSTFTNLSPGDYTFTYLPISNPTATWDPIDSVILSSSVTLSQQVIGTPDFVELATPHSKAAARVLDELSGNATGGMSAAIGVLSSLSESEQTAALRLIAPETSRVQRAAVLHAVSGVMDTVRLRLNNLRTRGYSTGRIANADNSTARVATIGKLGNLFKADNGRGIWTKAFGSRGDQDMEDGFPGYGTDAWGVAAGGDLRLENDWILGGALSYATTDVDLDDFRSGDGSRIKTYQVTAYTTRDFGRWYVEGMLAYASHDQETSRNTGIAGFANASFDGSQWALQVNAGYPVPLERGFTLTPVIGIEGYHLNQDSYTETGAGALNLRVDSRDASRVRSLAGAKLSKEIELHNGTHLVPSLHAYWTHDFRNEGIDTTARFTGGGVAFTTPGQDIASNTYNAGAELTWRKTDELSFSARLDGDWRSDYHAVSGQLVMEKRF